MRHLVQQSAERHSHHQSEHVRSVRDAFGRDRLSHFSNFGTCCVSSCFHCAGTCCIWRKLPAILPSCLQSDCCLSPSCIPRIAGSMEDSFQLLLDLHTVDRQPNLRAEVHIRRCRALRALVLLWLWACPCKPSYLAVLLSYWSSSAPACIPSFF